MKKIVAIILIMLTCSFLKSTLSISSMNLKGNTAEQDESKNEKVSYLLKFRAAEGKKQELLDFMVKAVDILSSKEEGTEIHTVSTSPIDEYIYVYEVFSNEEALKNHQSTEAYKAARVKIDSLIDGPPQVTQLYLQAGKGLR